MNRFFLVAGIGLFFRTVLFAADMKIEIYGDSLSAGFMTEYSVTQNKLRVSDVQKIVQDFITLKSTTSDTQRQGILNQYELRDSAWPSIFRSAYSQSSQVSSLQNLALTGAHTGDLLYETQSAGYETKPTLAFVLIGHNDLCHHNTSVSDKAYNFQESLKVFLNQWEANHSQSRLFILPIGEIYKVYSTLAGTVWLQDGKSKFACEDSWRLLFPYCVENYHLFKTKKLANILAAEMGAFEKSIGEQVEAFKKQSIKNQYYYLQNMKVPQYRPEYFSIDCYHLSKEGQKAWADLLIKNFPG